MTKKNILFIASLAAVLSFTAFTGSVSAFSAEESGCTRPTEKNSEQIEAYKDCIREYKEKYIEQYQEKRRELKQEREEVKMQLEEKRAARCELTEGNVTKQIANFRESQSKHLQTYETLKERLANVIARLEEKGYDVAELQADLIVLEEKLAVLTEKFELFVIQLDEVSTIDCSTANGTFVAAMKEAKDALAEVRAATLDVKNYYVGTIKPDIVDLRNQIRLESKEDSRTLTPSSSASGQNE